MTKSYNNSKFVEHIPNAEAKLKKKKRKVMGSVLQGMEKTYVLLTII